MLTLRRAAGAVALACTIPTAALAAPATATLRVEGADTTLIPELRQPSDTTLVADRLGPVRTVEGPTALGQLIRAGVRRDVSVRTSFSTAFGPDPLVAVERIGPDDQGENFEGPAFWVFKVNHASAPVAANQQVLKDGDEVLWYFTSNFSAAELDVTVPRANLRTGRTFTVTVRAWDSEGVASPAAGAVVRYGTVEKTAGADGRVRFTARTGPRDIRATRTDAATGAADIRSATEEVCGLPAGVTTCPRPRPNGASLRLVVNGVGTKGWARTLPRLRAIVAGALADDDRAAIAWRGRVWRGPGPVGNVARNLVRRFG